MTSFCFSCEIAKRGQNMRIRKTRQDQRRNYIYQSVAGKKEVITVGKDGVTEIDIKMLHSMDDSEVYNNLKNMRPNRTDEEKVKRWKDKYIEDFEKEHGYKPNKEDVEYMANKVFPKNYNLSLDYDHEGELDSDKKTISYETATCDDYSEIISPWSEQMEELLNELTAKQRQVVQLMYVEGFKQSEIAKMLGISSAGVKKHLDKAKAYIKKNYK